MKKEPEVRYYHSYTDDFSETKNQTYTLPEDYEWAREDLLSRFLAALSYAVAWLFSTVYCRLFLHVRFKNRDILKDTKKTGAFLYGNHTQPIGDVFNPALACLPNRIYTLASPANLGIPVLGKVLPYLGALPIPDSISGMRKLTKAIEHRLEQKRCIIVYPEAHVWEYYTGIRPFSNTSFKYPVKYNAPAFAMTTTYQKRKFSRRPTMTIYFDGPFYPDKNLPAAQQAAQLRDTVYKCMKDRSRHSNCEHIRYIEATEE